MPKVHQPNICFLVKMTRESATGAPLVRILPGSKMGSKKACVSRARPWRRCFGSYRKICSKMGAGLSASLMPFSLKR